MANTQKYVYSFGGGSAEGRADMKELLGGKGANLAEMSVIGIPVPPGFTHHDRGLRGLLRARPEAPRGGQAASRGCALRAWKKRSARSSATRPIRSWSASARERPCRCPGMMNTILNLGLTDASVEGLAKKTGNPRFAYDGYRRLIDMFGSTAMGVEHEEFEHELDGAQERARGQARHRPERRRPQGAGPPLQGRLPEARQASRFPRTRRISSGRRSWRSSIAGWATRPSSIAGSSGSPG